MKENLLIHYLSHNRSFQILKDFLKNSSGLELSLMNLDEENQFGDIQFSKEPKITECERSGYKKILVPIFIKREVVGVVTVAESGAALLTQAQCNTILLFLKDFLQRLVNAELEFVAHFQDKELTHQQRIIKEAIEYIHKNYHDSSLNLKNVSSQKSISYHYLSHLFKKELKVNFSSYLTKVRIDRAVSLLKNKSLSVSQIAYHCGFEDPGYFSKTFKRRMGASPVDYRVQGVCFKRNKSRVAGILSSRRDS